MNHEQKTKLMALIVEAERLVQSLKEFADPLAAAEVLDSKEVADKVNSRICLRCGVHVPEGEFYMRGLHQPCYNTTMRRIRSRQWNERDLIAEGKLSVKGKPGKVAAMDRADQKSISESAEQNVDRKIRRHAASKKARKQASD